MELWLNWVMLTADFKPTYFRLGMMEIHDIQWEPDFQNE